MSDTEPASGQDAILDFVKTKTEILAKYKMVNSAMTIALTGVLLLFVALFYTTLTGNFTADKLEKAWERYAPDVASPVADATMDIGYSILPTYEAEVSKAVVSGLPQMAQVADRELLKLSERIGELAQAQLDSTFKKVIKAPDSALHKALPDLALTSAEVDAIIQDNLKQSEKFLSARMMTEVNDLQKLLFSIEDPALPKDELALSKMLVHNLLMVADQELMAVK